MKKFGRAWVEPISGMTLQMYVEGEGASTRLIVSVNHKKFEGTDVLRVREAANAYAASQAAENWQPMIRVEMHNDTWKSFEISTRINVARMWYNADKRQDASALICDWDDKVPTHRAESKYPIRLDPHWMMGDRANHTEFSLPYAQSIGVDSVRIYLPYTEEKWERALEMVEGFKTMLDNLRDNLYMNMPINLLVAEMNGVFHRE